MGDPIRLDPADYWQLRYRLAAVDVTRLRAQMAVVAAEAEREAHVKALAEKYPEFDAGNAHYDTDDAACALVRRDA